VKLPPEAKQAYGSVWCCERRRRALGGRSLKLLLDGTKPDTDDRSSAAAVPKEKEPERRPFTGCRVPGADVGRLRVLGGAPSAAAAGGGSDPQLLGGRESLSVALLSEVRIRWLLLL